MVSVTIEVRGLNRLDRALKRFPQEVRGLVMPAISASGQILRGAVVKYIRRTRISGASGKLQQAIAAVDDKKSLSTTVGPNLRVAPYGHHIALGRAPAGELPGKGPPTMIGGRVNRPFLRWANVKAGARLSLDEKGARDAYPIARAIRLKGHKAQPYMEPAAKEVEPKIVRLIEGAVDEAIRRFGRG